MPRYELPGDEVIIARIEADHSAVPPSIENELAIDIVDLVHYLLDTLSPEDRELLIRRFGIDDEPQCQLSELAEEASITESGMMYRQRSALKKLGFRLAMWGIHQDILDDDHTNYGLVKSAEVAHLLDNKAAYEKAEAERAGIKYRPLRVQRPRTSEGQF